MPWIPLTQRFPPEGEPVLLWNSRRNVMHTGTLRAGAFFTEDAAPLEGITHWAWPLDSYSNWEEPED